jgi:hypothetical protein
MVNIDYDPHTLIISITIEGEIGGTEIRKNLVKIAKEFKYLDRLYVLADYSQGVIKTEPSFFFANLNIARETFMETLAPFEKYYNAYIITDDTTKLVIDQFHSLIKDVNTFHPAFFSSVEEAKNWLLEKRSAE